MIPVPQIIIDMIAGVIPEIDGNLGELLGVFAATAKVPEYQLAWADDAVRDAARAFQLAILKVKDTRPQGYPLLTRTYEYSVRLASIAAISRAGLGAVVTMSDMAWGASWALESVKTMVEQASTMMSRNDHESDLNAVIAAIKEAKTIRQSDLLRHRNVRHITA